jgi:hypothetical protein
MYRVIKARKVKKFKAKYLQRLADTPKKKSRTKRGEKCFF